MNNSLDIGKVHVRLVENGTDGLLAWATVVLENAIKLDNLAIRRSCDGSLYVTYPAKRSSSGKTHQYFHPINTQAAEAIQNAILARLASLAKAAAEPEDKKVK
ncbi:MAG: SpoVG family protein [Bacteroidales bacterium]|nr:SpoVG family protein [Candidatus Latescibacterota bacterium]